MSLRPSPAAPDRGGSLIARAPDAARRLLALDAQRWGRSRRMGPGVEPPPIPRSALGARWIAALTRLSAEDEAGAELAVLLLRGQAAGGGSADLQDDELRLSAHVVGILARRYRGARAWALGRVGEGAPALTPRLSRAWALVALREGLRGRGAHLAGTLGQLSYVGVRTGAAGGGQVPGAEGRAFRWFCLADLVSMGVQQHLLSVSHDRLAALAAAADLGELFEVLLLACLFGEGRSFHAGLTLLEAARGRGLRGAVEAAVRGAAAQLDPPGALPGDPAAIALGPLEALLAAPAGPPADPGGLNPQELVCIGHEADLREAEAWLGAAARGRGPDPGWTGARAWSALRSALQAAVADPGPAAGHALRAALDGAVAAAARIPEHPWWPGDGEEYRVRRQRSAAEGDRLWHLIGLGERVCWALRAAPADAGAAARQDRVERGAPGMWIEELCSRYGPRLAQIFGVPGPAPGMPVNRALWALDTRVAGLVRAARDAGGDPRLWGELAVGCAGRLRELLRRDGVCGEVDRAIEGCLDREGPLAAARRVRSTPLPGAQPGDLDAHVTVAVHVFHADPDTVRQNLVRNEVLDWRLDRRHLVLGTSSADPACCAAEREMCLERGVTWWHLSARRHKKAGNQNRIIPNAATDAAGRGYYLTLDDDYQAGPQVLQRVVPLAEAHPRAAFVQLPMYLYGNELLGVSAARYADAAGMSTWGAYTSPGLRDVRLGGGGFAGRRPLALPFGTCTLLRLDPAVSPLADTNGFHTESVTEDFAQGQLAFGMKYAHHPRPPQNRWEDGLLLDEIWICGDGVELLGRIAQQNRWCEGSIRNAATIWTPALRAALGQALGLRPAPPGPAPGALQLAAGSLVAWGYALELASMGLFLVGFPLTSLVAVPDQRLVHSLAFWGGLWLLHMAFYGWMAVGAGMSVLTFLDQHFIRFASVGAIAQGIYQALRDPARGWSANKDPRARVPPRTLALFGLVGLINLIGLGVGLGRGMPVYALCAVGVATAAWQLRFLRAVPMEVGARVGHLPRRAPRAWLAERWLRTQGAARPIDDRLPEALPRAAGLTALVAALTVGAVGWRYLALAPDLPGLVHRQPLFVAWIVCADACQLLSLGWLWTLAIAGLRSREGFSWGALMAAGREAAREPAAAEPVGRPAPAGPVRAAAGWGLAWALGRRPLGGAWGFAGASALGLLTLGFAGALRWPHLSANSAYMDESFYVIAGQRFVAEGMTPWLAEVMFGSYLYPVLAAAAHAHGGLGLVRAVNAALGALTALAIAQAADRLGGPRVGLLAGLLCAISSQHIYISALGTYDAPAVAGGALALALVATATRCPDRGAWTEGRVRAWLSLAGGAAAVAILVKYVAAVVLPPLALAALAWSPEVRRRDRALRLLALGAPVAGAAVVYAVRHRDILLGWWRFSRGYQGLVEQRASALLEIYLWRSVDLLAVLALAALGAAAWVWAARRRELAVTAAGVAVFAAFHGLTRADQNFAKHVTFTFPFLLPLAAAGLAALGRGGARALQAAGLPRGAADPAAHALVVAIVVVVGLQQVDRVHGSLRWWPDTRPVVERALTRLRPGDRVLTDDTGLELALIERGIRVDTPFWAAEGALAGPEGAAEALARGRYAAVVLTGGVTTEGALLSRQIARRLPVYGYRPVYGQPSGDDRGRDRVSLWVPGG